MANRLGECIGDGFGKHVTNGSARYRSWKKYAWAKIRGEKTCKGKNMQLFLKWGVDYTRSIGFCEKIIQGQALFVFKKKCVLLNVKRRKGPIATSQMSFARSLMALLLSVAQLKRPL